MDRDDNLGNPSPSPLPGTTDTLYSSLSTSDMHSGPSSSSLTSPSSISLPVTTGTPSISTTPIVDLTADDDIDDIMDDLDADLPFPTDPMSSPTTSDTPVRTRDTLCGVPNLNGPPPTPIIHDTDDTSYVAQNTPPSLPSDEDDDDVDVHPVHVGTPASSHDTSGSHAHASASDVLIPPIVLGGGQRLSTSVSTRTTVKLSSQDPSSTRHTGIFSFSSGYLYSVFLLPNSVTVWYFFFSILGVGATYLFLFAHFVLPSMCHYCCLSPLLVHRLCAFLVAVFVCSTLPVVDPFCLLAVPMYFASSRFRLSLFVCVVSTLHFVRFRLHVALIHSVFHFFMPFTTSILLFVSVWGSLFFVVDIPGTSYHAIGMALTTDPMLRNPLLRQPSGVPPSPYPYIPYIDGTPLMAYFPTMAAYDLYVAGTSVSSSLVTVLFVVWCGLSHHSATSALPVPVTSTSLAVSTATPVPQATPASLPGAIDGVTPSSLFRLHCAFGNIILRPCLVAINSTNSS